MINTTSLILVASSIVSQANQDDNWTEILRDALTSNQAAQSEGRAKLEIDYTPDINSLQRVRIECDVIWKLNKSKQRFRLHAPAGLVLGRQETSKPLEEQDYDVILQTGRETLWYVPSQKIVQIRDASEKYPLDPLLQFAPADLWFKCCPPNTRYGRKWQDMLGLKAIGKNGTTSKVSVTKESADIIVSNRHDPDGGRMIIKHSLLHQGNPIQVDFIGDASNSGYIKATYEWAMVGNVSVLRRCVAEKMPSARVREATGQMGPLRYELKVPMISLKTVHDSEFDKVEFLKSLPKGTKVTDIMTKRSYYVNTEQAIPQATLRQLVEQLRNDGFAKKH